MSLIPNPQSILLREPNLFTPGKKPIGRVRIDWSHPITKDLQSFVLLGSNIIDLVGGNLPVTNTYVQTVYKGNQALKATQATADQLDFGYDLRYDLGVSSPQSFTLWHKGEHFGRLDGNGYAPYMTFRASINKAGMWLLWCDGEVATSDVEMWCYPNQVVFSTDNDFPDGDSELFMIHDGSGSYRKFHNGVKTTSTNASCVPISGATASTHYKIGCWQPSSIVKEGATELCAIWHRSLSDDEVDYLRFDPYQFLIPA